ncbi:hypothetical protein EAG_05830 [Camponotus floridanus]|uniref:WD repeat-containing protein 63 n=1 Tax=Camponotus floridanus TaxID=104421 RepID=E2AZP5_CAMFO|nr:hypothetical protein EAG_05830 [Camponotus floridanus]
MSDRDHSHELPIRQIQWLPSNYRIEPSGKLTKLSTCSSCQFMTTSEDGTLAIWDLLRRKSDCTYTACCWSNRPGIFLMGTSLGDLEIWDIEKRANKPVLTQTISKKPITLLSLRVLCKQDFKLIGAGDCNSAFRIFEEPAEIKDDILEKGDWFEEYVWREIRRKKIFSSWQKNFLQNDATIITRRQTRMDEEHRLKLEMTRIKLHREHEERLKLEAEEKIRKMSKSKDIIWKLHQQDTMKKVLLEKKKFVPQELEEKRLPLIRLTEERNLKMNKGRNEIALRDKYFDDFVSLEFSDYDLEKKNQNSKQRYNMVEDEKIIDIYLQKFYKIRNETRKIMAEKSISKFARIKAKKVTKKL